MGAGLWGGKDLAVLGSAWWVRRAWGKKEGSAMKGKGLVKGLC